MSSDAESQRLGDLARLRQVRDRIDREYTQPLDVEALARGVHMSAGHLSREFKRAYGEPPYSYLMTRRIERAMALLRRGDLSVTEVCFEVGCSSLGTFSTRFTELVGVSPSAYREQMAGGEAETPSCITKQVTRPVRARSAGAGSAGAGSAGAGSAGAGSAGAGSAGAGSAGAASTGSTSIRNGEAPAAGRTLA